MKSILFFILTMAVYMPTDAERARWTMFDIRSWKTAFDAYKTDHGAYPNATTFEQARAAVEPMYMKIAPLRDAWGNAYRIESNANSFRVVSSGADGLFQADTSTPGQLQSFNDDAVATESGNWLFRYWNMRESWDVDRAQSTLYEMRVIRTAVEGYGHVHNEYPSGKTMEDLQKAVQPDFIKILPMHDAWGTPFLYERDDKVGYRVVSAGADGKFDRATWSVGGATTSFAEDAVANGDAPGWFRYWETR